MEALEKTFIFITNIKDGSCTQQPFKPQELLSKSMAPELHRAVNETMALLNQQGGDFVLDSFTANRATVRNTALCPGLLYQDKADPYVKCDTIERFIKKYCRESIHPGLDANFVECSCDYDSHCEIMYSFDP